MKKSNNSIHMNKGGRKRNLACRNYFPAFLKGGCFAPSLFDHCWDVCIRKKMEEPRCFPGHLD